MITSLSSPPPFEHGKAYEFLTFCIPNLILKLSHLRGQELDLRTQIATTVSKGQEIECVLSHRTTTS